MASASEQFAAGVVSEYGKLGGAIADVASQTVAAAAEMVAAVVDWTMGSVDQAIDFESAFAGVIKTVDATDDEMEMLRAGILNMTRELPDSANSIAAVAEAAGQLGIEVPNILGFTRVMSDLGVATNMSSDDAAMSLARLANITGMSQTDFDRLGSTIVELGNNLATTEGDIVSMALRIAGAGTQIGLTEPEILALSGALSSVGIQAEMGGSAISRVMIEMATRVANGGEELEEFASIAGMSSDAFRQAYEENAAQALLTFIGGLDRASQSGENVFGVLEDLGLSEIRVRDALLRSSSAVDLFSNALDMSSRAWDENIALTTEAEMRYGTTESKMQLMRNQVDLLRIGVGDQFIPLVGELAGLFGGVLVQSSDQVIDVFGRIAEWIGNVVAAIAPAVENALPQFMDGLMQIVDWFVDAAGAGDEWGQSIARLVADAGAFTAWLGEALTSGNLWNEMLDQMSPGTRAWTEALAMAAEGVAVVVGKIGEFVGWVMQTAAPLAEFIAAHVSMQDVLIAAAGAVAVFLAPLALAIAKMAAVGAAAVAAVALIRTAWEQDLGGIATFVTEAWNRIVEAVEWAMTTLEQAWSTHGEAITSAATTAWEGVQSIIQTVWDAIVALVEAVWPKIEEIVRKGQEVIEALFSNHGETVGGVFEAMWDVASQIVETAWQNIQTIIETGLDIISGLLDVLVALLEGDWAGAWEAAQGVVQTAWDGIVEIATNSFELLTSLFETYGTPIIEWFTETFPGAGEVLAEALDNILAAWEGLWEALQGLMETIRGETSDWMETLEQFWADHGDAIMEIVDRWLAFIIQLVTSALENLALLITAALQLIQGDWEGAWESIKAAFENTWELIQAAAVLAWEMLKTLFQVSLADIVEQMRQGAQDAVDRFVEGLQSLGSRAAEMVTSAISTMTAPLSGLADTFRSYAEGAGQAFTSALSGAVAGASAAASNFGNAVTGALGISLDSQSPSRVFMRHGEWAGEGFVIGLDNLIAAARQKVQQMVDATLSVMGDLGAGGGLNRMAGSRVESAGMAAAASTIQSFSTTNSVMNQFGPVHVSTPMDWAEMEFRIRRIIDDLV